MKKKILILASLFLLGTIYAVNAIPKKVTPKKVIITRHANKIPHLKGAILEGPNELDLQGYERAAALAYYFSGTRLYNTPPITHVFATGLKNADSSVRPIETCTPTANHYHLPLNIDFNPTQTKELAQEILTNPKYNGSTILVCWEHHNIRPLVLALGAEDPGKWNADVFDEVYMLVFDETGKPTLTKILQRLMYGDRATFDSPEPPLPPATTKRTDED